MKLADDPRWQRLNDATFRCACCGESLPGMFDIAYDHPDHWPHGSLRNSGQTALRHDGDFLNADLCDLGDDRFIKGLVELPLIGSDRVFAFGAWVSLHPENFDAYVDAYGTDREHGLGPYFGWLCNALPLYGNADVLETSVHFHGGTRRPSIRVTDTRTDLARDQTAGISLDRLLDIYAASGTDLRPHLGD